MSWTDLLLAVRDRPGARSISCIAPSGKKGAIAAGAPRGTAPPNLRKKLLIAVAFIARKETHGATFLGEPKFWGTTSELPGPGEQKAEAPTTCGPLISDSCIPIEEHHYSLQMLGALSFYTHQFSPNWRHISAGGNFYTFNMPVKFTYGPTKNLETYIVVPFIVNWCNDLNQNIKRERRRLRRHRGYHHDSQISRTEKGANRCPPSPW